MADLPSLLLLPAPPDPATRAALGAAYRPPLEAALAQMRRTDRAATLLVAVAAPWLGGPSSSEQTLVWPDAQALLAGIYTLIAVLCQRLDIATDINGGPGAVDARVVLVDLPDSASMPSSAAVRPPILETNNTIVVDLPSFAATYHPWQHIFFPQDAAGQRLKDLFTQAAHAVQSFHSIEFVAVNEGATITPASATPIMHLPTPGHACVCLGGTFDHLHPGHKLLLSAGALLLAVPTPLSGPPCEYVIGITGDQMLRNKRYAAFVQPWDERALNVLHFLGSLLELRPEGWQTDKTDKPEIQENPGDFRASFRNGSIVVQCVRIDDAYGPTIQRPDITCLIVSAETRSGGRAVNNERAALGWQPLEVFEVDVLSADEVAADMAAEGFDGKISSTEIRRHKAEAAEERAET